MNVPASIFLLETHFVPEWKYLKYAEAPSISIPESLAAVESAAPLDSVSILSSIVTLVELIVVVVPSTCKLPRITTVPVASP